MSRRDAWTQKELGILRELYPNMTAVHVARSLPGRTPAAVGIMANKLGLTKSPSYNAAASKPKSSTSEKLDKIISGRW